MYYSEIKKTDIANGEGVRVSLFVSGCRNCWTGCFNQETWDFCYGQEFTPATEDELLYALEPAFINGLTILGGEPFEPENQQVLAPFLQRVKQKFPQKTIWCYTGYRYEELLRHPQQAHLLRYIDVLVDGPFVQALRDESLLFRGSSNQRLIDVPASLQAGEVVLFRYDPYL